MLYNCLFSNMLEAVDYMIVSASLAFALVVYVRSRDKKIPVTPMVALIARTVSVRENVMSKGARSSAVLVSQRCEKMLSALEISIAPSSQAKVRYTDHPFLI